VQKAINQPFARITYTEAIEILSRGAEVRGGEKGGKGVSKHGEGGGFVNTLEWGGDLGSEHERYLTELHLKGIYALSYI
jgi:aspartyl/asparaginyl-tRNA synthetase